MEDIKRIDIEKRKIKEIGYFEEGMMKWKSWGMEGMRVEEGKKDFKKRNGVKVVMKMKE